MKNTSNKDRAIQITFDDNSLLPELFGEFNSNILLMEKKLKVRIDIKANIVNISGEPYAVSIGETLLKQLYRIIKRNIPLYQRDIAKAIDILLHDGSTNLLEIFLNGVYIPISNIKITPKGPGQKNYLEAMRKYDVVFAIGPAGTGKTYLAMAMAISSLLNKELKRIILIRPAVEAGEKLGFLPGDMVEKVNPYLRPLYDALHDMMDFERAKGMIERGQIEIAPLAFMRGRTLNDCFVILDEAQNTTIEQMKMFLTRLGNNSKAVITGDITQIDLPSEKLSGLIHAQKILQSIYEIKFCTFTELDIVRHPVVQKIIEAYENDKRERIKNGSRDSK